MWSVSSTTVAVVHTVACCYNLVTGSTPTGREGTVGEKTFDDTHGARLMTPLLLLICLTLGLVMWVSVCKVIPNRVGGNSTSGSLSAGLLGAYEPITFRVLGACNVAVQRWLVAVGLGGVAARLLGAGVHFGHSAMALNCSGKNNCADSCKKLSRPILALDLDDTLVHSFSSEPHWSLRALGVPLVNKAVLMNRKFYTVIVGLRPHLITFLREAARHFRIVIYTAGEKGYADALLDAVENHWSSIERKHKQQRQRLLSQAEAELHEQKPSVILRERMYRSSCRTVNGMLLKDVRLLNNDMAKVAIVDNCPTGFALTPENGILIGSWEGDPLDRGLLNLLPLLRELSCAEDIRLVLRRRVDTGLT